MNDLFEQLAEDLNPQTIAEELRQVEILVEIKQIQNDDWLEPISKTCSSDNFICYHRFTALQEIKTEIINPK